MKKRNSFLTMTRRTGLFLVCAVLWLSLSGVEARAAGSPQTDSFIGIDSAESIALSDAGVRPEDALFSRTELDHDDGRYVYEVEFTANGMEYEYTVDALDGTVISWESESRPGAKLPRQSPPAQTPGAESVQPTAEPVQTQKPEAKPVQPTDEPVQTQKPAEQSALISLDEAKAAAVGRAGLELADVSFTKAGLETDDGRCEYELEFRRGIREYDCTVDAVTGGVLEFDREYVDGSLLRALLTMLHN